jgi:hypothetical protein
LIHQKKNPAYCYAPDNKIVEAYSALKSMIIERLKNFNEQDWEVLSKDFFHSQGAHIPPTLSGNRTGGSTAVIEFKAIFESTFMMPDVWYVQVRQYRNKQIDRIEIEDCYYKIFAEGQFAEGQLCFVSVYGFTEEARVFADKEGILTLEASDFVMLILSGKVSDTLKEKLRLPDFDERGIMPKTSKTVQQQNGAAEHIARAP